jgi:hypothetical protein
LPAWVPHPFVFKAADFDVSTLHESRSPSPETFLRTLRLAFCRVQLPKSHFAVLRVRHPPIGIAGEITAGNDAADVHGRASYFAALLAEMAKVSADN